MPSHQDRVRQNNCEHELDRGGKCIKCEKKFIIHYPTKVAYWNSIEPDEP